MRAKFIDVNGVRTRYLYEGSGDPLVLLHGSGAFADNFYKNIDTLADAGFAVYAPDLIGHGFTDPIDFEGPPEPHMSNHVAQFVDLMGFDRFFLAGWSMGCLMACLVYFAMPERVRKLVLISGGSCFNKPAEVPMAARGNFKNVTDAFDNLSLEGMRKRHLASVHPKAAPPEEILMSHMTSYARPGMRDYFVRMHAGRTLSAEHPEARVYDRVEQIKVPTLVLSGKDDPRIAYSVQVEGVKRLPNAKHVAFDECGHRCFYEYADEFHEVVLDFLREPE